MCVPVYLCGVGRGWDAVCVCVSVGLVSVRVGAMYVFGRCRWGVDLRVSDCRDGPLSGTFVCDWKTCWDQVGPI